MHIPPPESVPLARRASPHPPAVRDDKLDLQQLGRMARELDQISRESGRDWPAVRFVEWLRDEWRASQPEQRDAA
jgi:hypothetical protein